jgi:hypothetical protein
MRAVEMECKIQVKTYEMTSPTGVLSTLKLCWSEWPLPEDLFPMPLWQHLRMGSFYACWRLVAHGREDFTSEIGQKPDGRPRKTVSTRPWWRIM